jgi:hypothetical protein
MIVSIPDTINHRELERKSFLKKTSELTKMAIFGLLESQVEFPIKSRILVDFPWSRISILSAHFKYSRGQIQPLEAFS